MTKLASAKPTESIFPGCVGFYKPTESVFPGCVGFYMALGELSM